MKSSDLEIVAAAVFALIGGILIAVASVMATGYAASAFWNMAMPDLFDLPAATVRNGIGLAGLAMCVKWMTGTAFSITKE